MSSFSLPPGSLHKPLLLLLVCSLGGLSRRTIGVLTGLPRLLCGLLTPLCLCAPAFTHYPVKTLLSVWGLEITARELLRLW